MRRSRFYREALARSCVKLLARLWLYRLRRYRPSEYVTTRLDCAALRALWWADGWHRPTWSLRQVMHEGWNERDIPKSRRG